MEIRAERLAPMKPSLPSISSLMNDVDMQTEKGKLDSNEVHEPVLIWI